MMPGKNLRLALAAAVLALLGCASALPADEGSGGGALSYADAQSQLQSAIESSRNYAVFNLISDLKVKDGRVVFLEHTESELPKRMVFPFSTLRTDVKRGPDGKFMVWIADYPLVFSSKNDAERYTAASAVLRQGQDSGSAAGGQKPGEGAGALEFSVAVDGDTSGKGRFGAGDPFRIQVTAANNTLRDLSGVRVRVQGDDFITFLAGGEKKLGVLKSGEKRVVWFGGKPLTVVTEPATSFGVEVVADGGVRGVPAAGSAEVKVAFSQAKAATSAEAVALDPVPGANRGRRAQGAALVVGISHYANVDGLQYAASDAELVGAYLEGVFGIPKRNVTVLTDEKATKGTITGTIDDRLAAKDYDFLVFYFAGHGVPDPDDPASAQPYLIPYDGDVDLKSTLLSLNKELVPRLERSQAKTVFLVMDACFSGAGGRSPSQSGKRGIAVIGPKFSAKRCIILTASTSKQPSLENDQAGHGLFTYWWLAGMKTGKAAEDDGSLTLGGSFAWTRDQVSQASDGKQVPTLQGGTDGLVLGRVR